ncbi:MAG TPA: hypothetical protein VGM66_00670 [Candidatus Udaeobacter sp.]|jgi:hypothetical protein
MERVLQMQHMPVVTTQSVIQDEYKLKRSPGQAAKEIDASTLKVEKLSANKYGVAGELFKS